MRKIEFSDFEKDLITRFLSKKLTETYATGIIKGRIIQRLIRRLEVILEKIGSGQPAMYNYFETHAICAHVDRQSLWDKIVDVKGIEWLELSDEIKQVIMEIDSCTEIRIKCGFFKKQNNSSKIDQDIRYTKYLTVIDQLKRSKSVVLSTVTDNDYYKIGFITEGNEILSFDLSDAFSIKDVAPTNLNGKSLTEYVSYNLQVLVNKKQAWTLLSKGSYSPNNQSLEFVKHLLLSQEN